MLEMRAAAMSHLDNNGLIALFPSGAVAASDTMFGPAIEGEWNVFTAKMIRKSGATVVPFYFTGRIPAGTRSPTRFRRCCGRAC
jgi:putative hemolysin